MLIASQRHTARDLEQWRIDEEIDAITIQRTCFDEMEKRSIDTVGAFAARACYTGTSWGKDSVVIAHLLSLSGARVPLVWVRVDGRDNPDCVLVRDQFLASHDMNYHEIRVGAADGRKRLRAAFGFEEAARRFGDRHISGVRADESMDRLLRMARWGESTDRTCAPIGWWSTAEVFAYLHAFDLPVHPAYAQTGGGLWDRNRIRVATIGGERGRGHGRAEWEARYYPEMFR